MSKFTYYVNCVDAPSIFGREAGDHINAMKRAAVDITRATFVKHVDKESRQRVEKDLGYALHPKQGLTMAKDWHPSYYKGVFVNKPCYYFVWSGVEYIFTEK